MGETLGGVFNPQAIPEQEFLARYSVRLELTERLKRTILSTGRNDEPEHIIIQGQRGQGKTSLLRRLDIALRDSAATRGWLVPLLFKEELYGVTNLCRFWEETAELLAERPGFETLPDAMEAALDTPHYDKDCFLLLDRALADRGIRLVLLVDNLGDLFGKLKRPEQQRLREILHTSNRVQIIGASTVMLEQHYDHGAPFYQFFREVNLPGLDEQEALTLLRALGSVEQRERLELVIEETPGRIETLRRLTAGVPRTLVMLFDILLDRDGNAFRDLELLLDRVTPLYKHRMDDLPTQQQAIVDAVALGWDALSCGEVARATRLPSKQVAAQLKQLERANVIHRVPTSTKNNLYRLEERFFNIWYLMRHGRRGDRRRALWLVRFLEIWCSPADLKERAIGHLEMLEQAKLAEEHAWLMTEALRGAGLDLETEDRLVKATREYVSRELRDTATASVAEVVDLVDRAFPAVLPVFDVARLSELRGDRLKQYVATGIRLATRVQDSLTERAHKAVACLASIGSNDGVLNQKIEELATLKLQMPCEECSEYPGLNSVCENWQRENEEGAAQMRKQQTRALVTGETGFHIKLAQTWVRKQQFAHAFILLQLLLPNLDMDIYADSLGALVSMLLAADQNAYLRRLFEDEAFAQYQLKDRFKPHYFALLAELGESRADDFKRMPPELAQTVEEIREEARELRQKHFEEHTATSETPGA